MEYDFEKERHFSYKGIGTDEIIRHLARFISDLWQIHVFGEGNTRTTTVFFIKYLRTLGYDVTNDTFAEHSWYFCNAMVRANYKDLKRGIHETTEFLELFLRNLLLGEKHALRNRYMYISGAFQKQDIDGTKQDIEDVFPFENILKDAGMRARSIAHAKSCLPNTVMILCLAEVRPLIFSVSRHRQSLNCSGSCLLPVSSTRSAA